MALLAVVLSTTVAAHARSEKIDNPIANKIVTLAQDRQWLRLLHLVSSETPVISGGFYLSPAAPDHIDSGSELDLNLRQAQTDPQYRCHFPARDAWLRKHFAELDFVPRGPCPELDEWRAAQSVDSISIVYPDRNIQTSLGVFSHTFLKFNLSRWSVNSNLNVALGFAAELNPQEPMMRMISMGLFGGYVAKYTFSTYDTEVNRYGETESRDIFEYDLNLTKAEIDFLLDHLWELLGAEFHYYFLNGNCSYHLLVLLEVARPELDLTSHFHVVTVPSTSLRVVLQQENLIGAKRWIPGKQTRQNQMTGKLSPAGKAFFKKWRHEKQGAPLPEALRSAGLAVEEEAVVLDLLAESTRGKPESADVRREALNLRSQRPAGKDPYEGFFPKGNPETAHGVEMIGGGLGGDFGRAGGWAQLRYRVALHNTMDPSEGYFKNSTFELGDLRLRYSADRQFENSSVGLLNAVILQPTTDDGFRLSWQARSRVLDVLKSPTWQNSGGIGWSKDLDAFSFYAMTIADSHWDKNEKLGMGVFAGASAGLAFDVSESFRVRGNLDHLWPVQSNREDGYDQGELQIAYARSTAWSLQLDFINSWRERSVLVETLFYY